MSSECLHILDRALEKEVGDRYQSINDVLIDLRRLKRSNEKPKAATAPAEKQFAQPEITATKSKITKKNILWFGIPAIFVVVLLFFLVFKGQSEEPVPILKNTIPISQPTDLIDYPSWSNDGLEVAYQSYESGNYDILIKNPISWVLHKI